MQAREAWRDWADLNGSPEHAIGGATSQPRMNCFGRHGMAAVVRMTLALVPSAFVGQSGKVFKHRGHEIPMVGVVGRETGCV